MDPRTADKWLRGGAVLGAHKSALARAARKLRATEEVAAHRLDPAS